MKKYILTVLSFFLFSILVYAQTDSSELDLGNEMTKMLTSKITMQVDSLLYHTHQGNFYISEKPEAMIMAVLYPQPYDKAKAKLLEDVKKKNVVIKDFGEFEVNGKKIVFKIGEMNDHGKNMIIELYAVESTKDNTIFVTGVYLPVNKKRFANTAKIAASTAKLE
jgi:hypothetical protein